MTGAQVKAQTTALEFVFLLASGAIALLWGTFAVEAWTRTGFSPGARDAGDFWPTWIFGQLGLTLLFSFKHSQRGGAKGAPLISGFERFSGLVLALIAWALSVEFATTIAAVPSAQDFGGGPVLRPFALLLGLGLGWYAFGGPTPPGGKFRPFVFEHTLAERSLVLFTIFCTANGKLFMGAGGDSFSLILVAGLVTAVLLGRGRSLREIGSSLVAPLGIPTLLAIFVLPAWWWIAAANAAAPDNEIALAWRLLVPASVSFFAMASLSKDGIRRVFCGLVFGFSCALLAGLLGVLEALEFCSLEDVLHSRLRILGLHPNLGAALLAIGLPITIGWILAPQSVSTKRRVLGSFLVALSSIALYLTASRAGGLGAIVGLVALWAFALTGLPRRLNAKLLLSLTAIGAAAFLLFLTPLGDGIRASLDAKAQTQSAIGQRWHIWKMAGDAALDHPVTGIGPVGFSGHAQYAEPSYYDGTSQTLHTHNIFLAAVSGAGFPGLVLFIAWLIAFFGLGFRSILTEGRGHPLLASVVAAAFGLFVCNLFDLGQTQLTFLPLFYWIALALFGAQARLFGPPVAAKLPVTSLAMPLISILALWPTAISALAGNYLVEGASQRMSEGDVQGSIARLEAALLPGFSTARSETRALLARQYGRQGQVRMQLATLKAGVEESSYNAQTRRLYAEALLAAGQFEAGAVVAQRAFELDPRGAFLGQTRMLQAWAAFELGDVVAGSAHLVEGFASEASPPKGMRYTRSPQDDSVTFQTKDHVDVSLAEILAQLGENLVALASRDEVRARRELTGLIEGYRFNHAPALAAPWIRRVIDGSKNPIRATYYQEIEVLLSAGLEGEARAVWEGMDLGEDTNLSDVFTDLFAAEKQVADRQLNVSGLDIFFVAGQLIELRLDWAARLSLEGKRSKAVHEIERAIYDSSSDTRRTKLAFDFLVRGIGTKEQRIEDCVRFLYFSSLTRKGSMDEERFLVVFSLLSATFEGDLSALHSAVVAALGESGGLGLAGENFLAISTKMSALRGPSRGQ